MKFCLIAPIYDLDLTEQFEMHLLLSWMCENEVYRTFYQNLYKRRKRDKIFIILDNGANEKMYANENYLDNAAALNAKEVQAPDVQFDYRATMDLTKQFLKNSYTQCKDHDMQIMGIPQGTKYKDFKASWDWMAQNSKIATLGLGYRNVMAAVQDEICEWSDADWMDLGIYDVPLMKTACEPQTFKYMMSRLYFLKRKINLLELEKEIHLLGLWNPAELKYYHRVFSNEERAKIRSCDSGAPFQAAQVYVEFDTGLGVGSKPREYLDLKAPLGKVQRQLAERNLDTLKSWLDFS